MQDITLSDFVDSRNQEEAAALLNCVQGSISKMLQKNRDIHLVFDGKGEYIRSYEVKDLSSSKQNPTAA